MVDIARLRAVANDAKLRSDAARASSRGAMGRLIERRNKFARSRARAEARASAGAEGGQDRDGDGLREDARRPARRPSPAP